MSRAHAISTQAGGIPVSGCRILRKGYVGIAKAQRPGTGTYCKEFTRKSACSMNRIQWQNQQCQRCQISAEAEHFVY